MTSAADADIVQQFVRFYTARGWSRRKAAREISLPYSTLEMIEWGRRYPNRQILGDMLLLMWRYNNVLQKT